MAASLDGEFGVCAFKSFDADVDDAAVAGCVTGAVFDATVNGLKISPVADAPSFATLATCADEDEAGADAELLSGCVMTN